MGLFEEAFDITANILGKKYKTCPGCNEPISIYHNQTTCNNDRLDRRRCKKCGDKIVRGSGRKTYCSASCANRTVQNPGIRELQQFEKNENFKSTGLYETNKQRKTREEREIRKNTNETGLAETNKQRAKREFSELEQQRAKNKIETGYYETDGERRRRERTEKRVLEKKKKEEDRKKNCYVCSAPKIFAEFATTPTEEEQAEHIERIVNNSDSMRFYDSMFYCDECDEKISSAYYKKKYSKKYS